MTAKRTASEIGRSNRRRGADFEGKVERFLHDHGHPHAVRRQSGGPRDRGDIHVTDRDGDLWALDCKTSIGSSRVEAVMETVERQARNAGAPCWALILKRPGMADIGGSYVWLPAWTVLTGDPDDLTDEYACVSLRAWCALTSAAGVGEGATR